MINFYRISLLFIVISLLSSCSTSLKEYQSTTPKFDIKQYFNGQFLAWGMVQDYNSKITRRFCVELNGTWRGNKGTLAEKFYFNDGEMSDRTWKLTQLPNGFYTGIADDVVGVAEGQKSGFAFQWQYQLLVPIDGATYQFLMDDWMYQIDEQRVMNRTSMSKLGIKLAEITLFFDKSSSGKTCHID